MTKRLYLIHGELNGKTKHYFPFTNHLVLGWNNENKFPQKEPSNVVYREDLEM